MKNQNSKSSFKIKQDKLITENKNINKNHVYFDINNNVNNTSKKNTESIRHARKKSQSNLSIFNHTRNKRLLNLTTNFTQTQESENIQMSSFEPNKLNMIYSNHKKSNTGSKIDLFNNILTRSYNDKTYTFTNIFNNKNNTNSSKKLKLLSSSTSEQHLNKNQNKKNKSNYKLNIESENSTKGNDIVLTERAFSLNNRNISPIKNVNNTNKNKFINFTKNSPILLNSNKKTKKIRQRNKTNLSLSNLNLSLATCKYPNKRNYNNKSLNKTVYHSRMHSNNDINNIIPNNILTKSCQKNNKIFRMKVKHQLLETILEADKSPKNEECHYLENTISMKNKIVKKNLHDKSQKNLNSNNNFNKTNKTFCKKDKKNFYISYQNYNENATFLKPQSKISQTNFLKYEKKNFFDLNNSNYIKTNYIGSHKKLTNNKKYIKKSTNRFSSVDNNLLTSIDKKLSSNIAQNIFEGKIENYLITKELGKGSYAIVKLATHKITKQKFAIKIYSKVSLLDSQKRNTVKNEINILKQLNHENIMKLYEVIDNPSSLYLVLEYINGSSLLDTMKKENIHFFEEKRAIKIILQIINGISYCHSKNICHRDLKLENILLIKGDIAKIIDFGFAIKCSKDTYNKLFCGSPSYMPPEIVNKQKYIAQYSEIWSLGVLMYAMFFGQFPFKGENEDLLFESINNASIIFPEYVSLSKGVENVLKKIFVVIPNQRPSLEEIANDLKDIN